MEQNKTELQHQKKLPAHSGWHSRFPYSSYMMHQRKAQSLHGHCAVALHNAVQMNSCPCRKQALSWNSYHESHELALLQVLSRVRLKNSPLATLNLMLSKWKGGKRVGTNSGKPFGSIAYWRQTTGSKASKDLEPAEANYPSRILSDTIKLSA